MLGAYYAMVHDTFEEIAGGAKMVTQGVELPDWRTFVYTCPIKIPVLVDSVRTLKEQERPRPFR